MSHWTAVGDRLRETIGCGCKITMVRNIHRNKHVLMSYGCSLVVMSLFSILFFAYTAYSINSSCVNCESLYVPSVKRRNVYKVGT